MSPDFTMLDALDEPLDQVDEAWFIEQRDSDAASEFERQSTFLKKMASRAPQVDVVAIPNSGDLTDWERVRRWREGARKGALDLVITWEPTLPDDRGTFYAEFKSGKGKPDRHQRERLNRYYRMGHGCGVYRTAETLIAHLRERGCPVREVRR